MQIPFRTKEVSHSLASVDILAAKGCDELLVKLVQHLAAAGNPAAPMTGQTIYGGDMLAKRDADAAAVITKLRYEQ